MLLPAGGGRVGGKQGVARGGEMTAIRGGRRRGRPGVPQKDFELRGRGLDVGAEGRGPGTPEGTWGGRGASLLRCRVQPAAQR